MERPAILKAGFLAAFALTIFLSGCRKEKSDHADSLTKALPSLPAPQLDPAIAVFNANLDSANADFAHIRKSLK